MHNEKANKIQNHRWKTYAFDEDGKMLYGWVNEDATRASDESDLEEATYYMGSREDSARKTRGWFKIVPPTEDTDGALKTGTSMLMTEISNCTPTQNP